MYFIITPGKGFPQLGISKKRIIGTSLNGFLAGAILEPGI